MDAWVVYALFSSFAYCASLEINSLFKVEGKRLNAWRSLLATLLFIPFIFYMEWPAESRFYLAVLFTAVISVYGMNVQYRLAAEHNSRVAGLVGPTSIITAFVLWFGIDSQQRTFLLENPEKLITVVSAMAIVFASVALLRRNATGWAAFRYILPVGVLYGAYNVLAKLVLETGLSALQITLCFIMLSNLVMAAWYAPYILRDTKIARASREGADELRMVVKAGLLVALFHSASWTMTSLALIDAPNPAYPTIVGSLTPVWYMLYYKLRGMRDDASPVAGATLFLASMMIILAQ